MLSETIISDFKFKYKIFLDSLGNVFLADDLFVGRCIDALANKYFAYYNESIEMFAWYNMVLHDYAIKCLKFIYAQFEINDD